MLSYNLSRRPKMTGDCKPGETCPSWGLYTEAFINTPSAQSKHYENSELQDFRDDVVGSALFCSNCMFSLSFESESVLALPATWINGRLAYDC